MCTTFACLVLELDSGCLLCGIFVCLVPGFIVCLVSSFRYNGLATVALAAFGRVRALRASCGHVGPAWQAPKVANQTACTASLHMLCFCYILSLRQCTNGGGHLPLVVCYVLPQHKPSDLCIRTLLAQRTLQATQQNCWTMLRQHWRHCISSLALGGRRGQPDGPSNRMFRWCLNKASVRPRRQEKVTRGLLNP